jgi:hypothetical protein
MLAWWIAKLTAIIVGLWAGVAFIAQFEFQNQLKIFHDVAKPEIREMVDSKIRLHRAEAEFPVFERLDRLEGVDDVLETKLNALKEAQDRNTSKLNRIDEKIDQLLERR